MCFSSPLALEQPFFFRGLDWDRGSRNTNSLIKPQNFIESECFFPLPDFQDEALLTNGELTGSLHGLVPKSDKAAAEGVFFRQQLGKLDWSDLKTPPILLNAGGVGEQGQSVGEASGDGAAGRSGSPQMKTSDPEEEHSRRREERWGWGEGVVVGVVGGVLASICVVVLTGAIKRGMRGNRSYEDVSNDANLW